MQPQQSPPQSPDNGSDATFSSRLQIVHFDILPGKHINKLMSAPDPRKTSCILLNPFIGNTENECTFRGMADFLFIDHFISDPDPLFHQLLEETVWDERMKARKTASFGIAYNYSQITYADAPFPDSLSALCGPVREAVGFEPNNCLLNYYPDGRSSMGFHSDTATGRSVGTGVAIVSLGAAREMRFRHKQDKENTSARMLIAGSLIYLDDATQEHWLHAIPKAEESGPRISLSFRSIETGDPVNHPGTGS